MTCPKCLVEDAEFYKDKTKKSGLTYLCKTCCRAYQREKETGVTAEQYSEMFLMQGGLCAICAKPETGMYLGTVKQLSVDHNHVTSKARALLCAHCNHGVGKFKDDPALLRRAAIYLEAHA